MARGSKKKYTHKQKRQAEHIEEGYEEKGMGTKRAAAIAWATVNKESGGGEKKGGSGRRKSAVAKAKSRQSVGKAAAKTRKKLGTGKGSKKAKKPPVSAYIRKGTKKKSKNAA